MDIPKNIYPTKQTNTVNAMKVNPVYCEHQVDYPTKKADKLTMGDPAYSSLPKHQVTMEVPKSANKVTMQDPAYADIKLKL